MELPTGRAEGKKEELKEGIEERLVLCAQMESAVFPKVCNGAIGANHCLPHAVGLSLQNHTREAFWGRLLG